MANLINPQPLEVTTTKYIYTSMHSKYLLITLLKLLYTIHFKCGNPYLRVTYANILNLSCPHPLVIMCLENCKSYHAEYKLIEVVQALFQQLCLTWVLPFV